MTLAAAPSENAYIYSTKTPAAVIISIALAKAPGWLGQCRQMTSATLKIINPPTYPIAAMPTKRKLMVAAGFFGTLMFLIGIFTLIELLDRTLRDKLRTERITGGKVLGAFPAKEFRRRAYESICTDIATQYMSNAVLNLFRPDRLNIVNILSTQSGDGKSYIAEHLAFDAVYLFGSLLCVVSMVFFNFYVSPHFHRNKVR